MACRWRAYWSRFTCRGTLPTVIAVAGRLLGTSTSPCLGHGLGVIPRKGCTDGAKNQGLNIRGGLVVE